MIELERTFLIKEIPERLKDSEFKEIIDVYYPKHQEHPVIRLRKSGDKFVLTKKEPLGDDKSEQKEQNIILTEDEFNEFLKLEGKKVHKRRYLYEYNGRIAEVDVFQNDLKGLIVVDFEFDTPEEKSLFQMPEFCLCDVTQEEFIAGGKICGKTYEDVRERLEEFGYEPVWFDD
jgi:CYTH domain-containing protein